MNLAITPAMNPMMMVQRMPMAGSCSYHGTIGIGWDPLR
jgi:hypothetical protein